MDIRNIPIYFTLTKQIPKLMRVQYQPVRCLKCQAVLNPFSVVDYVNK
jgi:hypothetical protein